MYVVASGAVAVGIGGRELRRFGPGESFGEVALLGDDARTADAYVPADATEPCAAFLISRESLERVLGPLEVATRAPLIARAPIFAHLGRDLIESLARALQLRTCADGESVLSPEASEEDPSVFFVEDGVFVEETPGADEHEHGVSARRELTRGDCFGDCFGDGALVAGRHVAIEVRSRGVSNALSLSVDVVRRVVGGEIADVQLRWRRATVERWVRILGFRLESTSNAAADVARSRASRKPLAAEHVDVMTRELVVRSVRAGDVVADSATHPNGVFVGVVASGCVALTSRATLLSPGKGPLNAAHLRDKEKERGEWVAKTSSPRAARGRPGGRSGATPRASGAMRDVTSEDHRRGRRATPVRRGDAGERGWRHRGKGLVGGGGASGGVGRRRPPRASRIAIAGVASRVARRARRGRRGGRRASTSDEG